MREVVMLRYVLPAFAVVSLVACGSGANDSPSGGHGGGSATATGTGAGTGGGGGDATPQGFSVTFDPITVAPGEEHTRCITKRLGNPAAMHVGRIHNVLGEGSHHMILYRTNDTTEQPTPFDCQPFQDLLHPEKGTPLMITQKKDDELELPKGVAFSIDANQMVRIELHYINPTSEPIQVTATATFLPMPDAEFQNEADFLFVGNPDISIPPHSSATLGPTYMPVPADLADAKFFGFTGHTHQWGTKVTVATTTAKDGPDTPVYDVPNWQWGEPATVYYDPPVQVPQGGGFHFTCAWNNGSDATVQFGESANDEMCFFWSYYYPSKGSRLCAHTDQVAGGYDVCCPGNPVCGQLF